MVERPEIILEGQLSSGESRELNFRWKPGDVSKRPKQVAPHQPRLDWQMWFAALGNYHHNPWFVHFIAKLLQGCSPVVDLIDEPKLARNEEVLASISSILYIYDFTRLNSEKEFGENWWVRVPTAKYLPSLEHKNPSLLAYLASHKFADNVCPSHKDI